MIIRLLSVAALLSLSLAGISQTVPVTTSESDRKGDSTQKVDPVPYLLAGEDEIQVTVVNFPNLSSSIVVPPDGKISVPLLEPLSVVGKTTNEVAQILAEKWRKYVVNPAVTVSLSKKRRENVLMYGFVTRVGTLEYRQSLKLVEALAEAGGPLPNGDLSKVTVTHKSGEKQILDLSKPETKGGTDVDILLGSGDVIYVPERRTQVSVLGEVGRPGSFDYKDEMTVLDALTSAGGVKESADLGSATLIQNGAERKLDLEALLRHGDISINAKLGAGDRILVPEFLNRTYTFGAVGRPGYYPFKAGDRVLDALNSSGGPVRDANLGQLNVIRIDRKTNTAKVVLVDIDKALKQGKMEGNIPLEPGDVLYVPDKKRRVGLDDLFKVIGSVAGLDTIVRIFTGAPR